MRRTDYARGDYAVVADRLWPAAVSLVEWCSPAAGQVVLDAAAGTGNVSKACRAHGVRAVAVDLEPALLGRARGDAPELLVLAADVTRLPLPDACVDHVLSSFGAIYAADPARVVGELARVCRPGGWIGLTTWPDGGFQRTAQQVLGELVTGQEPADVWSDRDEATRLLSEVGTRAEVRKGELELRFPSVDAWWAATASAAPPLVEARAQLGRDAFEELGERLREVARRFSHSADGGLVLRNEYLMVRVVSR